MRQNRQIRKRGKRKKIIPVDIDITSLLDILVIMLVFLLKSYNSSGVTFNIPKNIVLPKSNSQSINTSGVIIQVSPSTIWVDNKVILDTENKSNIQSFLKISSNKKFIDHGGRRIIPLFNELVAKKETIEQIEKSSPNAQKFSGVINLLVDKSMKYSFIKKIMYTAAEAGYKKYKFIVLGEEG